MAADINMWRRLTTNVVRMTDRAGTPAAKRPTAINCDDPAYTMSDIKSVLMAERPAFWARMPKAMPIGM
jgi:hypothetical protein